MDNVRRMNPRDSAPDDDGGRGFERVPPQDLDAEQAVLGAMLLARQAITDVTAVMEPGDHYRPAHETIHRAILDLHETGDPADPITLTAALNRTGHLTLVGGAPYLHHLVNTVPTASNAQHYAEIVRDKARLRRLVEAATRIANSGYAADGDIDDIMEAARKEFDGAATTSAHGPSHLLDSLLDWDAFYGTDFGSVELLPGRLMAPGQQITIVGDGKAGKSLLVQEWMWRMASGRPFLDDQPADPVPVLYLDAENGQEQVQERFYSFGAGPGRMGSLRYASFPPVRPLDTAGGGADLMAMVKAAAATVVVLDTVSRFISGPENDADTWLNLYRHTLLPLKRDRIASIRLDHFGKDGERGARGSSAKNQDVDHVWTLSAQGGGMLSLKRTHTRTGIGPDEFAIRREARRHGDSWLPGGTRHVIAAPDPAGWGDGAMGTGMAAIPGTVEHIIAQLDAHQVPADWGSPRVIRRCAELGMQVRKGKVEEAVRVRKARGPLPAQMGTGDGKSGGQSWAQQAYPDETGHESGRNARNDLPPDLPPTTFNQPPPETGGPPAIPAGQTSPGEVGGTSPRPSTKLPSPHPPSQEGGGEADPGEAATQDARNCVICLTPITDPHRLAAGHDTHHPCPTTD